MASMASWMKKKASYVAKDSDPVSVKAGDRLDALNAQTAKGKMGPFAGAAPTISIGVAIPKDGGGLHSAAASEGLGAPDAAALADHHQKLADYFSKAAGQATPNTSQLNPYERSELDDEINMQPKQ